MKRGQLVVVQGTFIGRVVGVQKRTGLVHVKLRGVLCTWLLDASDVVSA